DALLLAAGELDAALAHDRVELFGQRERLLEHMCLLGRLADAVHRLGAFRLLERQSDVARHGGGEEEGVLLRVTDRGSHGGEGEVADVDAVEEDRTARRGKEAREEFGERGLARSRAAHDRQRTSGGQLEGDVRQHLPVAVGEGETADGKGAYDRRRWREVAADHLRLGVEDLLDARKTRAAALHDREGEAEGEHGPGHASEGEPEGEEGAGRKAALLRTAQKERTAVPEEDEDTHGDDRAHQRTERSAQASEGE